MKKTIAIVLAAAILGCTGGCMFKNNITETADTTTAEASTTAADGAETTTHISTEVVPAETDSEGTDAEITEAVSTSASDNGATGGASSLVSGATIVGYSTKGYEIAEKDGFTYVDGILIVNKTYSIPESYNPGGLTSECQAAFNRMAEGAAADGLQLWVQSGFRSWDTQNSLYTRYCNSDGQDAADRYSARPGHSEHQTGLAIDVNSVMNSFKDTPEGIWLAAHCTEYGFILRYPEGKESQTGYIYEPWHVRYIGDAELAQKITDSGLCLEEYLGITSVYA